METLPVKLFKGSYEPFVALLDEYGVEYRVREARHGVIMAAGETVELIRAVGDVAQSAAIGIPLAKVLIAWINRPGRKARITMEHTTIDAEGRSVRELAKILEIAKNIIVFDTNKIRNRSETQGDLPEKKS